mgnify:FL=1
MTRVLCGIDYSNIFLIIAGTNTPVLFALSPSIRWPYLTVIWAAALVGTVMHIVWLRAPNWVFTVVYVVLGLAPVTLLPALWTAPAVGPAATVLIACGGAAYIAGATCFAICKPNPIPGWFEFHEVFHMGTVIGYTCTWWPYIWSCARCKRRRTCRHRTFIKSFTGMVARSIMCGILG